MKSPFLLAGLLALAGCSSPSTEPGDDVLSAEMETIRKIQDDYAAAWAAHDAAKIASFYATDAFIQLPNRPVIDQIDAIRRELATMAADPNVSLKTTTDSVEMAASADVAWAKGSYSMAFTDPATGQPMTEAGHYVTTYRKVNDGTWRIVADAPTPTAPPAPSSAARSGAAK